MKKLSVTLSLLILLFCLTSQTWALPPCQGNQNDYRHNCYGSFTFSNGNYYQGEWKNNKINGEGTFTWKKSGNKYVGKSKDGLNHGFGIKTWKDAGSKYIGEWEYDKEHGQGTMTWAGGNKYVGTWKHHKKHGQGTFTYANGKIEDGEWKNNKLNGFAKVTYADGTIEEGIWKNDKFLYSQKKPTSTSNPKIERYKSFCSEIGFTPGTQKFGECVVEAMKKV